MANQRSQSDRRKDACEGTIAAELDGIDLQDKRLNRRAVTLLEALEADPQASLNAAHCGWGETLAAYRFMSNPNVTPDRLLAPHRAATRRRIACEPVTLLVQDTTELDFTTHPTRDAGLLNAPNRRGFYDHSSVAFTPGGLCLGVLDAHFFSRTAESLGKSADRESEPFEMKESFRWLRGYRLACELQAACPERQIVSVADSDCDIYDIFLELNRTPDDPAADSSDDTASPDEREDADPPVQADFVIRGKHDRRSPERDPDAGGERFLGAYHAVAASAPLATRVIDLPQTPKRSARTAMLEVRAGRVLVKPPHRRPGEPVVSYNVVLVEEVPPEADGAEGTAEGTGLSENEEPIRWLLLTTLPVGTAEAALLVVDHYRGRWPIETFFRTYKSGCRVEDAQLATNARLLNCLVLYKIVAWRVAHTTFLGRTRPDLPCDAVFSESEWQAVWKILNDGRLPETAPPLKEFLPLLARLGGHNGRRQDAPPGPQAVWTGIRRMTDFALAWDRFGPQREHP